MRFLSPRWILSHLFVVAMVVLMVVLGFWQLRRLDDRKESNAEISAVSALPPRPIEELASGPPVPDQTPVSVRGTYRPELEFLVANRTYDSQPGYWLVTPVELADGRLVAVSRGWVPRAWAVGDDQRGADAPTGAVVIEGRAFASLDGGRTAETGEGDLPEINRVDLAVVPELPGLAPFAASESVGLWVQLDEQQPAQGDLPVPVPPPPLDDGPHLSYALQWFFFAAGTAVVYTLILRRARRHDRVGAAEAVDRIARPGARAGSDEDSRSRAVGPASSPLTASLLAVRLRGRGTPTDVRATAARLLAGVDGMRAADRVAAVAEALDDAVAAGLVRARGETIRYSPTASGEVRLAELLAAEADATGVEQLVGAYEDFVGVNRRFLVAVSEWQLASRGDSEAGGDGTGSGIAEIGGLVDELSPLLRRLESLRGRFSGYRERFAAALDRAGDDHRWIDGPLIDSVHTVWFELHEHLLATVGRTRVDERTG